MRINLLKKLPPELCNLDTLLLTLLEAQIEQVRVIHPLCQQLRLSAVHKPELRLFHKVVDDLLTDSAMAYAILCIQGIVTGNKIRDLLSSQAISDKLIETIAQEADAVFADAREVGFPDPFLKKEKEE
jgi:hypothetical protein